MKILHLSDFFYKTRAFQVWRTYLSKYDEKPSCSLIHFRCRSNHKIIIFFLNINKKCSHLYWRYGLTAELDRHKIYYEFSTKNTSLIQCRGTIVRFLLTQKKFRRVYNIEKKDLTCKQFVFCCEHVYECKDIDKERARRREITLIVQYIRCFE